MRDLGEIFSRFVNARMCMRRLLSRVFACRKDRSVKDSLLSLSRSSTNTKSSPLGDEPNDNDSNFFLEFLIKKDFVPNTEIFIFDGFIP